MEELNGPTHPALLLKKCPECNFLLKNHFHLAFADGPPYWDLFCGNFSCLNFGCTLIRYEFKSDNPITVIDEELINEAAPDTSIESD